MCLFTQLQLLRLTNVQLSPQTEELNTDSLIPADIWELSSHIHGTISLPWSSHWGELEPRSPGSESLATTTSIQMEALTGSQQIFPSKWQVLRDQSYADTELKTQQTQ